MAESWKRAAKQEVSCSEIGSFNWFSNPSFASSEVDHLPRSAFFFFCLVANVPVIFAKPVLLPLLAQELNYRARPLWAKRDPGVGKACLHLRDVQRKVTKKQTCSSHKLEIICKLEECFTAELPPLIHPSKLIPLQENERSSSSPCNEKKIYMQCEANGIVKPATWLLSVRLTRCPVGASYRADDAVRRRLMGGTDKRVWVKLLPQGSGLFHAVVVCYVCVTVSLLLQSQSG